MKKILIAAAVLVVGVLGFQNLSSVVGTHAPTSTQKVEAWRVCTFDQPAANAILNKNGDLEGIALDDRDLYTADKQGNVSVVHIYMEHSGSRGHAHEPIWLVCTITNGDAVFTLEPYK